MWGLNINKKFYHKYIIKLKNKNNDIREMHFLLNDSEPTKKFINMINKSNDKKIRESTL